MDGPAQASKNHQPDDNKTQPSVSPPETATTDAPPNELKPSEEDEEEAVTAYLLGPERLEPLNDLAAWQGDNSATTTTSSAPQIQTMTRTPLPKAMAQPPPSQHSTTTSATPPAASKTEEMLRTPFPQQQSTITPQGNEKKTVSLAGETTPHNTSNKRVLPPLPTRSATEDSVSLVEPDALDNLTSSNNKREWSTSSSASPVTSPTRLTIMTKKCDSKAGSGAASPKSQKTTNGSNGGGKSKDIPRIPAACTDPDALDDRIRLGICAMDKKARSKPMAEILSRLDETLFRVIFFGDDLIQNQPVEDWPLCDGLIAFFSKGYPLPKAQQYVQLRKPLFILNDLEMQETLQDRRRVYDLLEESGIDVPRHVYLSRDGYVSTGTGDGNGQGQQEVHEQDDSITINGVTIHKPFVEKPVNAEDHNIAIYYPTSAGGGCKKLFRKVGNRSSEFYPDIHEVRRDGSYIYEEFVETQGTDVKMYTVGPDYGHAEARKSPTVDGKVERNSDGKEVRFPVILTFREKEIARRIVIVFKQFVCGFDILRVQEAHGLMSYVCDVNGWSFVKNSRKYYDDCAQILSEHLLAKLKPGALKTFSTLDPLVTRSTLSLNQLQQQQQQHQATATEKSSPEEVAESDAGSVHVMTRATRLLQGGTEEADDGSDEAASAAGDGGDLVWEEVQSHHSGAGGNLSPPRNDTTTDLLTTAAATLMEGALPVREFPDNLTSEPASLVPSTAGSIKGSNEEEEGDDGDDEGGGGTDLDDDTLNDGEEDDTLNEDPESSTTVETKAAATATTTVASSTATSTASSRSRRRRKRNGTGGSSGKDTSSSNSAATAAVKKSPSTSTHGKTTPSVSRSRPASSPPLRTEMSQEEDDDDQAHQEELRCVLAIVRHGDRTPKQKLKVLMTEPHILAFFHKHCQGQDLDLKVKAKAPLTEFLQTVKTTLAELPKDDDEENEGKHNMRVQLTHMRDILERWKIHGLNRKLQIKPQQWHAETGMCTQVELVLKWGGNLTKLGEKQAIALGHRHRHDMYPDAPGGGILRLHSTFRHDLKIKTSDEGRVMKTAAAFAKGLLELEGDLPPILVSLVHKEKGSMHMLDPTGNKEVKQDLDVCKQRITANMQRDIDIQQATEDDLYQLVGPQELTSLRQAVQECQNPRQMLQQIHATMGQLIRQLEEMLDEMGSGDEWRIEGGEGVRGRDENDVALSGVKLYKGETLLELTERWRFIYQRLYNADTDRFDLSRIPDVHDNVRFDVLHNPHLGLTETLQKLYNLAKIMADCVVPQEYGTTLAEKRDVGVKICHGLLEKIKYDLNVARTDNKVDMRYMINMKYEADLPINTMGRRIRTRLYFTSESHLHTVLNVFRFAKCNSKGLLSEHGTAIVNATRELCYLTQIVMRVFEDNRRAWDDPRRFRVEILFSPGAAATPLHIDEDEREHDMSRYSTEPLQVIGREGLTCAEVEDFFEQAIMAGKSDQDSLDLCSTSTLGDGKKDKKKKKKDKKKGKTDSDPAAGETGDDQAEPSTKTGSSASDSAIGGEDSRLSGGREAGDSVVVERSLSFAEDGGDRKKDGSNNNNSSDPIKRKEEDEDPVITKQKQTQRKYFWGTVAVASIVLGMSCLVVAVDMTQGRRSRRWRFK